MSAVSPQLTVRPAGLSLTRLNRAVRLGIKSLWLHRLRSLLTVLGSLLVLNLLIEYANLGADLSKNGVHFIVFIDYWFWNLTPFLVIALPMAFLLGTLLTLSEAALSREWLALRAGGVSLLRWIWSRSSTARTTC